MPSAVRVHTALLAVSLLFGGNFVFTKEILAAVPASTWVWVRMVAASSLMVPLALWLRRRGPGAAAGLGARRWGLLFVAAFFGVSANQALFAEGLARTTSEHSAVINSCIPTFTVLVAVLTGQERLSARLLLSIATALAGVLYLLGIDRVAAAPQEGATLLGDLLATANAFSFAVHLVLMRRIGRDLDPWLATAALFVFGVVQLTPWSAPGLTTESLTTLATWPLLGFAAYIVVCATVLTYALNTWALRHTHSSQVALYINLQPLVAAALGWMIGRPAPGHRFYVALALVASGLWLQTRRAKPR
ncbi:MAG: DMT family transporter [Planctomycetes bacterium]|nr:DMT family transporter [Planctomycetota bacterium]